MRATSARKCLCCLQKFHPDARNRRHQQYCSNDDCRKASKAASQARWLAKKENQDYFRGSANSERVRRWREANPGYWRRKTPRPADALQENSNSQPADDEPVVRSDAGQALQDILSPQPALLVGLIAALTGHELQEDIAASARGLLILGHDILRVVRGSPDIPDHEKHPPPMPREAAPRASPV